MVVPVAQNGLQFHVDNYACTDSMFFGFWAKGYYCYVNGGGPRGRSIHCEVPRARQRVQGREAWVVPLPVQANPYYDGSFALRSWGILSDEGIWLIPPVYDEPMMFKDGVAEVSQYGRHFKINEKGAFVE